MVGSSLLKTNTISGGEAQGDAAAGGTERRRTFSSMKLRQPSLGTKAAIFLPFLISCTRAHFRMAELGCFASIPLRHTDTVSFC